MLHACFHEHFQPVLEVIRKQSFNAWPVTTIIKDAVSKLVSEMV